jgi:hypothetical protein
LHANMYTTIWTVPSSSFFVIQVTCRYERNIVMSQHTPVRKALKKRNSKLLSFLLHSDNPRLLRTLEKESEIFSLTITD